MKIFKILWNILIMLILSVGILFLVIKWLDSYTRQSEIIEVPKIMGQAYETALEELKDLSLEAEIVDSIYSKDKTAHTIYDIIPREGSKVKAGRKIFLRIYSSEPNKVSVPNVSDLPIRSAFERLKRAGFSNLQEREVEGLHKGLCLGLELADSSRVEAGTHLRIDTELFVLISGKEIETLSLSDLISSDQGTDSIPQADSLQTNDQENNPDNWF